MFQWMIDCRSATRRVSDSMDRDLPFYQWMWLWIHLALCGHCVEFRRQMQVLREAGRVDPVDAAAMEPSDFPLLSDSARSRMRESIRSRCDKPA